MKRTILIIMLAFYTLLGHSQNVNHAEKIDSTEIKVKYVMTHDVKGRIINAARFTDSFMKLYGDSMIYECFKRSSTLVPFYLILNNEGSVIDFKIGRTFEHAKEFRNFFERHKWEILKEVISSYGYIYIVVGHTYVKNLTGSRYKAFSDSFPISSNYFNDFDNYSNWKISNIKERIDQYLKNTQLKIKTSIDEGLHPDDYIKYEYIPIDTIYPQKMDVYGRRL